MKKIQRLAIANRGEVAVRIIRAAQEMGIETVLLHSEADAKTLAFREADQCICIGAADSKSSYLNIAAVIEGAKAAGADALHPGFGFLSENADFAEACENAGLEFVGPTPQSIRKLGDKISAKLIAKQAQVPTIPGYEGDDSDKEALLKEAKRTGFPLLIKASGGGGGRGLKIVQKEEEFFEALESAQREAEAGFGNSRVFLERYFEDAKHIEVQVFGDGKGHVVHLFERECSVQRRHQKIIEEAPSALLTMEQRLEIGEIAKRLAAFVSYRGAGTVEFLFSGGRFYFMEMNTRLQVEHTVTEMVLGVDLVKAQLLVAQGGAIPWLQQDLIPRGHAIECRLYAEDPYRGGVPSTGPILGLRFPHGHGRRFEYGMEEGDEITSYYDPMIAKLIVWDENRPRAIQKMLKVLDQTVVLGVRTNIPLLRAILEHNDFIEGSMTTQFMGRYFVDSLKEPEVSFPKEIASALSVEITKADAQNFEPNPWLGAWS